MWNIICVSSFRAFDSIEIQEFQVVGSASPIVIVLICSRTWNKSLMWIHFETIVFSKVKIVGKSSRLNAIVSSSFRWQIRSRTNSSRGCFLKLCNSWYFWNIWLSYLIVFPCKKDKIIGGSTLEFFVSYSFQMLSIIFSYSRVIFSNHLIKTLIHSWSHRGVCMSLFLYSTRIG